MQSKVITGVGSQIAWHFEELKGNHLLSSIAAHGPSNDPEYTAVFLPVAPEPQHLELDLTEEAVLVRIDELSYSGWQLNAVTATGYGPARYAGLFAKVPSTSELPDLRRIELHATWQDLQKSKDLGGIFGIADDGDENLLSIDGFGAVLSEEDADG